MRQGQTRMRGLYATWATANRRSCIRLPRCASYFQSQLRGTTSETEPCIQYLTELFRPLGVWIKIDDGLWWNCRNDWTQIRLA